jgi:hypothetical protein
MKSITIAGQNNRHDVYEVRHRYNVREQKQQLHK